ncbi:hypothetical protein Efla_002789 [Eimeria flavescens]
MSEKALVASSEDEELDPQLEPLDQQASWPQPRKFIAVEDENSTADVGTWDLWKLSAPVPSLKNSSSEESQAEQADEASSKGGGPGASVSGAAAAAAAAVAVSLSSREASAMADAAPTRCPTEDTLHEATVSAVLSSVSEKQKVEEERRGSGSSRQAAATAGQPSTSEPASEDAASSSPPSLYALCELASELQRVLQGVQHVQRQIVEAQKNIAWAIGEPTVDSVGPLQQQQQQQQEHTAFSQAVEKAAAAAAAASAEGALKGPASLAPQQQRELCGSAAAAAVSPVRRGDSHAASLRSLVDLLGRQQQQQQQQQDELESAAAAAAAAARGAKLLKQLPLAEGGQWQLEGSSNAAFKSNTAAAAAAFMCDSAALTGKRGGFRSSSCSPFEQQQQQLLLEGEAAAASQQRMQGEDGLSARGPQRKRIKASSGVVDPAPMPGVRFAKDRNSWVAFWCENGKQNYKSFSNKKFGPEMARLMAIAARQSFDDRSSRSGAAGFLSSASSQKSPDSCEGCPLDVLQASPAFGPHSNSISTSSSTTARTPNAACDAQQQQQQQQGCDPAEEQQLSRAEMQQLAASLGNPKGVCYAPSNNTWMAYGSLGSGARMCRSFPVSKFGFYGARRLAIKAVSQYQQKLQQQQQQAAGGEGLLASRSNGSSCELPASAPTLTGLEASPLDYSAALQLLNAKTDISSPDSCIRRRRLAAKQLLHANAATGKQGGEHEVAGLQAAEPGLSDEVSSAAFAGAAAKGAAAEEGAAAAALRCNKQQGEGDALLNSDISMASALLLPLVASGRLMRFSEEDGLLRSSGEMPCLGVPREQAL